MRTLKKKAREVTFLPRYGGTHVTVIYNQDIKQYTTRYESAEDVAYVNRLPDDGGKTFHALLDLKANPTIPANAEHPAGCIGYAERRRGSVVNWMMQSPSVDLDYCLKAILRDADASGTEVIAIFAGTPLDLA